jgi:hypothetical protein
MKMISRRPVIPGLLLPGLLISTALPAFAGGMWFNIGNPEAVQDPAAKGAFATVRVLVCCMTTVVDPVLVGSAEGLVGNARVSMPLRFTKLLPEGLYAIWWERPKDGVWVLKLNVVEWGLPGVGDRFGRDHPSPGPDVFPVGEHGVSPQIKLINPYLGRPSSAEVNHALLELAAPTLAGSH